MTNATQAAALNTQIAFRDFNFYYGYQNTLDKDFNAYAWAVQSGDVGVAVSSVPVPAAMWLFGSGLLGLMGVARRKHRVTN